MTRRKLPIGIQAFRESREAGRCIDDNLLEQARNLLGTSSIRESVHCAPPEVVQAVARHREIEALVTMDGLDLADREIMKNAWRREDSIAACPTMPYLIDKGAPARMQHPVVRGRLAPIIESGEAATCSIADLEVLYSTRSQEEHARIRAKRGFACRGVDLTEAIFRRAIDVQGLLATRDQHRSPIPELIIAVAAESARMAVLHYDADFDTIAAVTGQDAEWVVSRGAL